MCMPIPPPFPPHLTPGAPPNFLTPPRPVPGRPRPTCKVSALYLENCANALRQTETDRQRQTDRDNPLYKYRYSILNLSPLNLHYFVYIQHNRGSNVSNQIRLSHSICTFKKQFTKTSILSPSVVQWSQVKQSFKSPDPHCLLKFRC